MFHKSLYKFLPIPSKPWEDFSRNLSWRYLKLRVKTPLWYWWIVFLRWHILCHHTRSMLYKNIANVYFKEIIHLHGVFRTIVSSRDTKFASHFWKSLWRLMGTKLLFSTSSHPQIDGQSEVTNRTLCT